MPAAAVIPAPIAYIKIVAVKKLVVGFLAWRAPSTPVTGVRAVVRLPSFPAGHVRVFAGARVYSKPIGSFTLKKLECSKQARAVNTLAWNNDLGRLFYFVGF